MHVLKLNQLLCLNTFRAITHMTLCPTAALSMFVLGTEPESSGRSVDPCFELLKELFYTDLCFI